MDRFRHFVERHVTEGVFVAFWEIVGFTVLVLCVLRFW